MQATMWCHGGGHAWTSPSEHKDTVDEGRRLLDSLGP